MMIVNIGQADYQHMSRYSIYFSFCTCKVIPGPLTLAASVSPKLQCFIFMLEGSTGMGGGCTELCKGRESTTPAG